MNNPKGFTFLEIIITLGVFGILFSISGIALTKFQQSVASSASDREILHILSTAARKARHGQGGAPWGVYIPYSESTRATTTVTVFCGATYATRDITCDDVYTVSNNIHFLAVDFSGAAPDTTNDHEIVFNPLSGSTAQYGSISLGWYNTTRSLSISPDGFVNRQ
ncbi:MAG: type II secretion system protein [Patescibacteria group bacterium]